jgi:hypothetical protein
LDGFMGVYAEFWTGFLGDWRGLGPILGIWVSFGA